MNELVPSLAQPDNNRVANKVVFATLNVNGLPRWRQNTRTRTLLPPQELRYKELCRQLDDSNIDIINFQEILTHRNRHFLQKYLPSFKYSSFEPALLGPKGSLLTLSRLPIEKTSYESYSSVSKAADRTDLPPFSLTKSKLKGILMSHLKEIPLTIINTHPLANDDWDWSPANRFHNLQTAQLEKLTHVILEQSRANDNVLLGCDLNVAKDSDLFRKFLGKSSMHDAFENDTSPTFHTAFLEEGQNAQRIDTLLSSSRIVVSEQETILATRAPVEDLGEIYLTDHQGLKASFTIQAIIH